MSADTGAPGGSSEPLSSDSSETRMTHFSTLDNAQDATPDPATHDVAHRATLRASHHAAEDANVTTPPGNPPAGPTGIERRLVALIESELVLPAHTVHAGTRIADLGDSLDWLELLMAVEDVFGVALDPARTKSIGTVADLLRLLPAQAGDTLVGQVQASVQQALGSMASPRPV
jgi:acyl carrier protein